VGDELIQAAQGAQSIVDSVTGIFGVVAGMLLYELIGIEVAILANAISFIFSGISEMFIKAKYKHEVIDTEKKQLFEDIVLGLKYMKQKTGLLTMMMFSLFLNFSVTPIFGVGIPFLFKTELEKDGFQLGYTNIAFSIAMLISGVLVGGIAFKSVSKVVRKSLALLTGSFAFTALTMFLITYNIVSYPVFYGLFILAMLFLATTMNFTNIPLNTSLIRVIEPQYRGRVFSTIQALATGAIPLSIVIGGIIISYSNTAILGLVCTALVMIPTIGFLTHPSIKLLFEQFDLVQAQSQPQNS
jgi:MFS family permease